MLRERERERERGNECVQRKIKRNEVSVKNGKID